MAIQTLNSNEINKIGGAGFIPDAVWSDLRDFVLAGDFTGFEEMWDDMCNEDSELDPDFPPVTSFMLSGYAD